MKVFKSDKEIDHLPSKELKTMSFELWTHLKANLEETQTSDAFNSKDLLN